MEKLYRLKEEVKKYVILPSPDAINTLDYWDLLHITLEALEEVEQKIDLILSEMKWNSRNFIQRFDGNLTQEHVEICEAALNAPKNIQDALVEGKELICLDDLDDEDFDHFYYSNENGVSVDVDHTEASVKGIKAVLKEYLKQK
jgi:hypothetical protein